jgi:hypothetical protein
MSRHWLTFSLAALAAWFAIIDSACSETWTLTSATAGADYSSVASSADGTKLVAASWPGIYTSKDSGASWVSNSVPSLFWRSDQHSHHCRLRKPGARTIPRFAPLDQTGLLGAISLPCLRHLRIEYRGATYHRSSSTVNSRFVSCSNSASARVSLPPRLVLEHPSRLLSGHHRVV